MTANNTNNNVTLRGTELVATNLLLGLQVAAALLQQPLAIKKGSYTPADLVKKLEPYVNACKDSREAKAIARERLAEKRRIEKEIKKFVTLLRDAIVTALGEDSADLAKFGILPPKARKELTVEEKALRAARVRQTRELRGTRGSRQKAEIRSSGPISVTLSDGQPTPASTDGAKNAPTAPRSGGTPT